MPRAGSLNALTTMQSYATISALDKNATPICNGDSEAAAAFRRNLKRAREELLPHIPPPAERAAGSLAPSSLAFLQLLHDTPPQQCATPAPAARAGTARPDLLTPATRARGRIKAATVAATARAQAASEGQTRA